MLLPGGLRFAIILTRRRALAFQMTPSVGPSRTTVVLPSAAALVPLAPRRLLSPAPSLFSAVASAATAAIAVTFVAAMGVHPLPYFTLHGAPTMEIVIVSGKIVLRAVSVAFVSPGAKPAPSSVVPEIATVVRAGISFPLRFTVRRLLLSSPEPRLEWNICRPFCVPPSDVGPRRPRHHSGDDRRNNLQSLDGQSTVNSFMISPPTMEPNNLVTRPLLLLVPGVPEKCLVLLEQLFWRCDFSFSSQAHPPPSLSGLVPSPSVLVPGFMRALSATFLGDDVLLTRCCGILRASCLFAADGPFRTLAPPHAAESPPSFFFCSPCMRFLSTSPLAESFLIVLLRPRPHGNHKTSLLFETSRGPGPLPD